MDCSRSCMFCKTDGPLLSDKVMLIHRLKLMFATDKFDAVLLKKDTCLICAGRILQVFDFYMVKSNVDQLTNETSNIEKCKFCLNKNIMDETDAEVVKKLAIQTKLIKEEDLNDQISCCYCCYNFLHKHVTIEESLIKETEIFNNQKNSTDLKENNTKSGCSRINSKRSRKKKNLSKNLEKKNLTKTISTEYNEATPRQSQHTVQENMQSNIEISNQLHLLPMTRLPFSMPTLDHIVKIERPEILSAKKAFVSVPATKELNSCEEIPTDVIILPMITTPQNLCLIQQTPGQGSCCVSKSECNPVLMKKKKKQKSKSTLKKKIMTEVLPNNNRKKTKLNKSTKPKVRVDQDTKQLEEGKTSHHQSEEIIHQEELYKIIMIKQAKLKEVTVNIEPLVYKKCLQKMIQNTTNPKKSNIGPKKHFIQFQKNVLMKDTDTPIPKKQKTIEEWRLEFNLSLVEIVELEPCEMVEPVTAVHKNVKKNKSRQGRKKPRKYKYVIKTQAIQQAQTGNNIQKMFNDGDFNFPDPTTITEEFLYYSTISLPSIHKS